MGRYASQTGVPIEGSQEQIKRTLRRYGAERFGIFEETECAAVMFEVGGITVRIDVPLPGRKEFALTETGRDRCESSIAKARDQAIKQRWRALLLAIKAKLEAVECGISTIEKEFLPFMVMPDGRIMADHLLPHVHQLVSDGKIPKMLALPAGSAS